MNSVIISFIVSFVCSFRKGLCKVLYESKIWAIIEKVYSYLRNAFQNSVFVSVAKYETDISFRKTSLFYKIFRLPVFFVSYMCEKLSGLIRYFADKSITAQMCYGFMNGMLAIDVKFIGILLFSMGTGRFASGLMKFQFNLPAVVLAVSGLILSFVKMRLGYYLDGSIISKAVKKISGLEDTSFKVYRKAHYVYLSAAVVGLLSGVLASVNPLLIAFPFALFGMITVFVYPLCGVYFALFLVIRDRIKEKRGG